MAAWNGGPPGSPEPSYDEIRLEKEMSKMAQNICRASMAMFALGLFGLFAVFAYVAIISGGWIGVAIVASVSFMLVAAFGYEVSKEMEKKS